MTEDSIKRDAHCQIADAAYASWRNSLDLNMCNFVELSERVCAVRQTFKDQRRTAATVEQSCYRGFPG